MMYESAKFQSIDVDTTADCDFAVVAALRVIPRREAEQLMANSGDSYPIASVSQ